MSFSSNLSSLVDLVLHVVLMRANEEMVWVDASGVVTPMTDTMSLRDFSELAGVDESVQKVLLLLKTNHGITIRVDTPLIDQASVLVLGDIALQRVLD